MGRFLTFLLAISLVVTAYPAEIHQATLEGNLDQVKKLLGANPELLNALDNTGKTPLHQATYNGQIEVAKYLIDMGADINSRTGSGSSPLHGAAFYNHPEAVSLLIKSGADVNIANNYGYTPILSAAAGGSYEIVKALIEAGADRNALVSSNQANVLLSAASSGNDELVDYLIDLGFDPNVKDNSGEGILHYAAIGGNLDLIKRLASRGIDVNVVSNDNATPLHYAAQMHHVDLIKYLLENGAKTGIRNASGETPIHRAVIWIDPSDTTDNALETIRILHVAGEDIDAVDNRGYRALFWLVHRDNPEILAYLIKQGADLNAQTEDGFTALHEAVRNGKAEAINQLVAGGAKVDIKETQNGYTPLHDAAIRGQLEVVKAALANCDNVNIKDNSGHTPLYYAGKYGHKKVAKLLKDKGANESNIEKNYGYTDILKKKLNTGEATLWYLGHCGWGIKTQNHFLIFDYWENGIRPADPCLANGTIMPEELKEQNVMLFVTHDHRDHFDSTIFNLGEAVNKLTYVFGFKPEDLPEESRMGYSGQKYEHIDVHDTRVIDGVTITTIQANDAGQGFLVDVDGLSIYYAGDHAGWREGERDGFTSEIDFLSSKTNQPDFAFVNVTGCHVQDTVALAEATFYTIDNLSPKVIVPTHGINRENVYQEYADKIHAKGYDVNVLCACHRGDKFVYKNEQIM